MRVWGAGILKRCRNVELQPNFREVYDHGMIKRSNGCSQLIAENTNRKSQPNEFLERRCVLFFATCTCMQSIALAFLHMSLAFVFCIWIFSTLDCHEVLSLTTLSLSSLFKFSLWTIKSLTFCFSWFRNISVFFNSASRSKQKRRLQNNLGWKPHLYSSRTWHFATHLQVFKL